MACGWVQVHAPRLSPVPDEAAACRARAAAVSAVFAISAGRGATVDGSCVLHTRAKK